MSYYGWKPYVPVAERRAKAEKAAAKAKKAGATLTPIAPFRGAIVKTFWGKAWCDNQEHYSDYESRLPRGRTYVRNGSVIDLQITPGEVRAQVMGSSLYAVTVSVTAVPEKQWKTICTDCSGSIDSLVELLQGKLSNAVMERICKPGTGLFPSPKEITFKCSCPDWASMCKHVAAVLYGIGARLDEQPEVLFSLRRVEAKDLVQQAEAGLKPSGKRMAPGKVLDDALLADVFGIEMAEVAPPVKPTAAKVAAKKAARPANATPRKVPLATKTAAGKKAETGKVAVPETKVATSAATPKAGTVATKRARARPAKDKG
ncbi:putative Zn finger protein [Polaromonas sp. CG_9.5]|uniref:SWIM zinc finger family protein n=1 Tax=Polaromonas sp. CG_9.5 TaxID=3071705 RepID=UPI002E0C27B8|nr:putative Zn finger protein [Polaromonas sp. CG_9.5]